MKLKHRWLAVLLVLALAAVLGVTATAAPTGFALSWWTIDGGGGTLSGSEYSLSGTIGQSDAGYASGSGYTLTGGFWSGGVAAAQARTLYLPLVIH